MDKLEAAKILNLVDDLISLSSGRQAGIMKQETPAQFQSFLSLKEEQLFSLILQGYADSIATTNSQLGRAVSDLVTPENIVVSGGRKVLTDSAVADFTAWSNSVWGTQVTQEILEEANAVVAESYIASKQFISRIGNIPNPFSAVDTRAMGALDEQFETWLSTTHGRVREPRISQILRSGFQETLATDQIRGQLELTLGNAYRDYRAWGQLASYQVNLARNIGQTRTYQQALITIVQYAAVIDNRTTEFCLDIDGKEVEVETLAQHTDQLLALRDPEDLVAFKPFVQTGMSEGGVHLVGGEEFRFPTNNTPAANAQALGGRGIPLPPFHHFCRTTTLISNVVRSLVQPNRIDIANLFSDPGLTYDFRSGKIKSQNLSEKQASVITNMLLKASEKISAVLGR